MMRQTIKKVDDWSNIIKIPDKMTTMEWLEGG